MVLCCICGVAISGPSHGARCAPCLQKEVDITEGVARKGYVQRCTSCQRFQKPPWVFCELESRELLALCLRHIKGISKEHQVVDANWIWTEPHSKELKVKLRLQKEAFIGVVVQQSLVVEFRIENLQCPDCRRNETKHTWESSVQVRQRADHRRTLLNLEQLIIKNKAHQHLIGVAHAKDGIDFYFKKHHDSLAFVAFIKASGVTKQQDSKHLVSHNASNSTYRFKRTTLLELCPVCRDDLVMLPAKVANAFGGLPSLMLCTRAASVMSLIDPASMRSVDIGSAEYWKKPFSAVATSARLTEFIVLDVTEEEDVLHPRSSTASTGRRHFVPCEVEVARVADFGRNDERLLVRSHLGAVLHPGDTVLGYDLRTLNVGIDDDELENSLPSWVYLVRKQKPPKPKPAKSRGSAAPSEVDTSDVAGAGNAAGLEDDDEDAAELEAAASKMLSALGQGGSQAGEEEGEVPTATDGDCGEGDLQSREAEAIGRSRASTQDGRDLEPEASSPSRTPQGQEANRGVSFAEPPAAAEAEGASPAAAGGSGGRGKSSRASARKAGGRGRRAGGRNRGAGDVADSVGAD